MPRSFRFLVAPLAAVLCLSALRADDFKLSARVGFPSGGATSKFKGGFWTPIYVQIRNDSENKKDVIPAESLVVVEMPDSDGMDSQYVQRLPEDIHPGSTADVIVLARPMSHMVEFDLSLRSRDDRSLASTKIGTAERFGALEASSVMYLAIGSLIEPLNGALKKMDRSNHEADASGPAHAFEYGYITQVTELPKRWTGYEGVDVIVLTTSNQEFVDDLRRTGNEDRLHALVDWVRHGGKLILSLGGTQNLEARIDLLTKLNLLAVDIDTSPQRWTPELTGGRGLFTVKQWANDNNKAGATTVDHLQNKAGEQKSIDVAKITLRRDALRRPTVVVPKPDEAHLDANDRPLIVQGTYGLGRVMLTAFDLDQAPFINWGGQEVFWQAVQSTFGPRWQQPLNPQVQLGFNQEDNDLNARLKRGLETIDDVPVVSFGWVALFIALYIIVVGPLDYFFLKKIVKRLELTWITFPVIVITISIGAYVAAYMLKGNDLKINKVDLVDIFLDQDKTEKDQPDKEKGRTIATQACGTTWFTLFSPQIKRYTIGLEPTAPDWVSAGAESSNPFGVNLASMNRGESFMGGDAPSSGGLFRGHCRYEPDGSGLTGVPIQVWQTKTFNGSWQANLAGPKPFFSAHLETDPNKGLQGWIENGLPVKLSEAVLIFGDNYFDLSQERGAVAPGERIDLAQRKVKGRLADWLALPYIRTNFVGVGAPPTQGRRYGQEVRAEAPCSYMKTIMFSGQSSGPGGYLSNGFVRGLDQGWRAGPNQLEEAILVARLHPTDGASEELTASSAAPTRLWLDELPKSGTRRPSLSGKMTQDTFVRIYIPVQPQRRK